MSTHQQSKRAAAAAFLGTTIEFYDFYVYATAAALALGQVFFPAGDNPVMNTLKAFGTFAVGFLARPLAGLVFGHLGDRLGRKKMLIFTMLLMGIATTGIGLIPSYSEIGVAAPILLVVFRFLQGISVGGEWGGAVLMASEHAPEGKKTFFASFAQLGSPAGLILCILAFRSVSGLDEEAFLSWGWRVPFLLSAVLLIVGFIIRVGVKESPEFEKTKQNDAIVANPVAVVVKKYWREIIFSALSVTIGSAGFFFTNTFMISYVTQYQGIEKKVILDALFWVTVCQFLTMPIFAWLSEKVGVYHFLAGCALFCVFTPYPMFLLVETKNLLLIVSGIALAVVALSALYAAVAGYMAQAFPTQLRYSGISIAYQLSAALAGGTTPLIGTWLAQQYAGQWFPLAIMFSVLSLMSLVGVLGVHSARKKQQNS